jgi:hypothetical protein
VRSVTEFFTDRRLGLARGAVDRAGLVMMALAHVIRCVFSSRISFCFQHARFFTMRGLGFLLVGSIVGNKHLF